MSDSKTMRETEIRKRAVCSLCRELIATLERAERIEKAARKLQQRTDFVKADKYKADKYFEVCLDCGCYDYDRKKIKHFKDCCVMELRAALAQPENRKPCACGEDDYNADEWSACYNCRNSFAQPEAGGKEAERE